MAAGSTKQVRHGRDHGANSPWVHRGRLHVAASSFTYSITLPARLELLSGGHVLYVRERAWLFRHSNAPNVVFCLSVFLCSLSGQKRETWWVRAPSHRAGIARDTREQGAQKVTRETNVTSEPTARPVRPGLGGRRWWNGWYGRWVLWRWSGPGLVTNGGGFGDLGRVDTKSTVRRARSSAGIFRQLLSFCLSLFHRGRNN